MTFSGTKSCESCGGPVFAGAFCTVCTDEKVQPVRPGLEVADRPRPCCIECDRPLSPTPSYRYGRCSDCYSRAKARWDESANEACCALCPRPADEGHHIIPKRVLRDKGLLLFMWDLRNQLPVDRPCHDQIEGPYSPLTRDLLPPAVEEFATELDLIGDLERRYGFRTDDLTELMGGEAA